MRIDLSNSEFRICQFVGTMRYHTTSRACEEQIQSTMNPLDIVIDGVIGEYCVAKHLNLHFSLDTDLRDWGADLVTYHGKTVDVKTTRKKGGNLNATLTSADKNFDLYVLCELQSGGADIVGWINRKAFIRPENIVDGVKKPYYSVTRDKLNPEFGRKT